MSEGIEGCIIHEHCKECKRTAELKALADIEYMRAILEYQSLVIEDLKGYYKQLDKAINILRRLNETRIKSILETNHLILKKRLQRIHERLL